MNAIVQRRARIAKIRGLEKRVSELALAKADSELKHVEAVVDRLALLKADLRLTDAASTGAALAAHSEMMMRLDRASNATGKPLADAIDRRRNHQAAHLKAHQKCEGANRLLKRSADLAAKASEFRADAIRVFHRSEGDAS